MKLTNLFCAVTILPVLVYSSSGLSSTFGISKFAGLNQTCSNEDPCTIKNSYCADLGSPEAKCLCEPDHVDYISSAGDCELAGSAGTISCLPASNRPGDKCIVDVQCTSGRWGELSHCSNGTCQCLATATEDDLSLTPNLDICVKLAKKLGDSCDVRYGGAACRHIPFSECSSDGQCACQSGHVQSHINSKVCLLRAKRLGDSCEETVQCQDLAKTECAVDSKTCQCLNNTYIENETGTGCLPLVTTFGEPCSINSQCQIENSWCIGDNFSGGTPTCKCNNGSIEALYTPDTCYKIRFDVQTQCNEDVQCTAGIGENSRCLAGLCKCLGDGVLQNYKCYPRVSVGDLCAVNEQCIYNPTEPPTDITLSCVLEQTGKNETIYKCRCPLDSHRDYQGICYEKTGYGLACQSSEQCMASAIIDGVLECTEANICDCPTNYMINPDRSKCIPKSVALGEKCLVSKQCATDMNQFCDFGTKTCICRKGYEIVDGKNCREDGTGGSGSTTESTASRTMEFMVGQIILVLLTAGIHMVAY